MNLYYLCEFAVLAKHCNFSAAAEELNLSQSSLSKHIRSLEDDIGYPLFERTTRRISLTEIGRLLLPYAERLYETAEEINGAVKRFKSQSDSNVRIFSIPVMAYYNLTGDMALFRKQNPDIKLTVSECESCHIMKRLAEGDCDLAFIRRMASEDDAGAEVIYIFEENLTAVMNRSHPLADKKQTSLSALAGENFLFLDKETLFYDYCLTLCNKAGFTPNVVYTGRRPENLVDLAAKGIGVALLTRRQAEYCDNDAVVCIDIVPAVKSFVSLIRMKNRALPEAARRFWNYMKKKYGGRNISADVKQVSNQ